MYRIAAFIMEDMQHLNQDNDLCCSRIRVDFDMFFH